MPIRTNKRTGEVQQSADGINWTTVKPPTQGGPAFSVQTRGPNPLLPAQTKKANNEAAASQFAPQTAQAEATIKGADAGVAGVVANAQARKAEADARTAQAQAEILAAGGPKMDPKVRADAIAGYNYAHQLQGVVDDLLTKFAAGPGSTHGVHGLEDYFPTTPNQQFDTTANKARGIVGQTLGFTGGQLNTEKEAERAIGPFLPQAGDRDEVIKDKIKALQTLADEGKAKAVQILGGAPDANGKITPVPQITPSNQLPPIQGDGGDHVQIAQGRTRDEVDPVLKGVATRVGQMLSRGVPGTQIEKFLRDNGVPPESTDLAGKLKYRATPEFKRWQRANPGAGYPIDPSFYTKKIPITASRALFNQTAATDVGGDVAAGLAASANAITGGRLDSMTGPNGQVGMDLLRTNHPNASFAGDMAGQASVEALAGRTPGVHGLLASRWGRRGADAAYGAYSGSGEDNEDPLMGGLTGMATNAGFGMLGRGAQKGLGRAATGVKNANLGYLNSLGVPLTLGQIGRGSDNVVGHALGGIEERMAGLPISDAIISNARRRGDEAFNRAAFNEIGVNSTGARGIAEGREAVGKAYGFLDDARLGIDPQFRTDLDALRTNLPKNLGGGVSDRIASIENAVTDNGLTGRGWQDAIRGVRADKASLRGQPFSDQAVGSLDRLEGSLAGFAGRAGPPGTTEKLAAANTLNSKFQTLASALDNGPAQKADELFSAGRLSDASRLNTRKFGGRVASMSGDRPFYDLTTAGLDAMPSLTPDSGTAGRSILYSTLLGGIGGGGLGFGLSDEGHGAEGGMSGAAKGALFAAALTAPYSKTGQRALQKALLAKRPRTLEDIGNFLVRRPKLAGRFMSTVGRDYVYQPELDQ